MLFSYKWYSVLIEWPEEDCWHCITVLLCESTQQVWSVENSSYQLLILKECKLHFQDLEPWEIHLYYFNIPHTLCLKQLNFSELEYWNGYKHNYWGHSPTNDKFSFLLIEGSTTDCIILLQCWVTQCCLLPFPFPLNFQMQRM